MSEPYLQAKEKCVRSNAARVTTEADTVAFGLHWSFSKRANDWFSPVAQFHLIRMRHQCSGEVHEAVFHVLVRLRARLHVRQAFLLDIVFDLGIGNHSTCLQVRFRTNKEYGRFLWAVARHFFEPVAHVAETLEVSDIEADHHAVRAAVERRDDAFETILPSSVPHLQFTPFSVGFDGPDLEIYRYK